MADVEKLRHAEQRGDILRILAEDYHAAMTSTGTVLAALDALGKPIAGDTLQFHLVYLADSQFVKIWRLRDMPGWREDRVNVGHPDQIRFAKLMPRGLQLLDGNCPADPQVRF